MDMKFNFIQGHVCVPKGFFGATERNPIKHGDHISII